MENKYYVVRIKFLLDGTEKKSELMEYATQLEAESKFYKNIGTDMEDDSLNGSMCMVIDRYCNVIQKREWDRTQIAPIVNEE